MDLAAIIPKRILHLRLQQAILFGSGANTEEVEEG
jgi:hypothetical protein